MSLPQSTLPGFPPELAGSMPAALFLDFDGVIIDSVRIKIDAYLQIYASENQEKQERILDHQRAHGGITRRRQFQYFEEEIFGRAVTTEDIESLSERFTNLIFKAVLECPLIPGADELLRCANRHAELHVISGTPHEELSEVIKRRGLDKHFRSWHGAPRTKRQLFEELLTSGNYRPCRVLAIGDAVTEYEAARELGIPFLGVGCREDNVFPQDVPLVKTLAGLGQALGYVDTPVA